MARASGETDPMVPQPYRVTAMRRETADTVTLDLAPVTGAAPFAFRPGQFNMLYVFGVGEVPISISGMADDGGTLSHTVRAVGAVTHAICACKRGDVVGLRGPFGRGWPVDAAAGGDVVLIAGGLGMAPLRSALVAMLDRRERYGNIVVLYGARSPSEILFARALEDIARTHGVTVEVTVDYADPEWQGHVGVVTKLIPRAGFDRKRALAMICGPEVMMRFCAGELLDIGVAADRIFLSMERNMKCAVAFCGHCQFGPDFVCREGPVLSYAHVRDRLSIAEV